MRKIRKNTFWEVTKRNLKSNLECAFCKKENCPLRYRAETREKYVCDVEMDKRMKDVLKKKNLW